MFCWQMQEFEEESVDWSHSHNFIPNPKPENPVSLFKCKFYELGVMPCISIKFKCALILVVIFLRIFLIFCISCSIASPFIRECILIIAFSHLQRSCTKQAHWRDT
ncbi:uncharacterized protein DS421_9g265610 [Arachis hypogaea]|nr:uncharacterized protein DS421_9g265610 [Arachis hypogaea]